MDAKIKLLSRKQLKQLRRRLGWTLAIESSLQHDKKLSFHKGKDRAV